MRHNISIIGFFLEIAVVRNQAAKISYYKFQSQTIVCVFLSVSYTVSLSKPKKASQTVKENKLIGELLSVFATSVNYFRWAIELGIARCRGFKRTKYIHI